MTLTTKQFNMLVTKEYLREQLDNFVTKQDFNDFKYEFLGVMDSVVKKLDNIEHAFILNQVTHDRFERRISNVK